MSDLLPCPFCGWTEIYIEPDERGSGGQWVLPIHVGCCLCGVNIMCTDAETKEEAATVWNRRTPSPVLRVEALPASPAPAKGETEGNADHAQARDAVLNEASLAIRKSALGAATQECAVQAIRELMTNPSNQSASEG